MPIVASEALRISKSKLPCKDRLVSLFVEAHGHPTHAVLRKDQHSPIRLMFSQDLRRFLTRLEALLGIGQQSPILSFAPFNANDEVGIEAPASLRDRRTALRLSRGIP